MAEQKQILLRMRDVVLTLGVAEEYGQNLSRTQLQKFIYLLDVIGYLYEILSPIDGHKTYMHGPYDKEIQNAVDSLAFRGFVEVYSVKYDSYSKQSSYKLSEAGKQWLKKIIREGGMSLRWEAARLIGNKVNRFGWGSLVQLVYAEPTFVSARPKGYGQKIEPYNGLENSAAFLFQILEHGLNRGSNNKRPKRELMVELFFRYLDTYNNLK